MYTANMYTCTLYVQYNLRHSEKLYIELYIFAIHKHFRLLRVVEVYCIGKQDTVKTVFHIENICSASLQSSC